MTVFGGPALGSLVNAALVLRWDTLALIGGGGGGGGGGSEILF